MLYALTPEHLVLPSAEDQNRRATCRYREALNMIFACACRALDGTNTHRTRLRPREIWSHSQFFLNCTGLHRLSLVLVKYSLSICQYTGIASSLTRYHVQMANSRAPRGLIWTTARKTLAFPVAATVFPCRVVSAAVLELSTFVATSVTVTIVKVDNVATHPIP
ncbi:hypothetical protein BKA93DRAFT_400596 [Sparassis latifolia]